MQFFPQLYIPTAKDTLQGTFQKRWDLQLGASAAATLVIATSSPSAPDIVRVITNCVFNILPGAAQRHWSSILYRIEPSTGAAIGAIAAVDQDQVDFPNVEFQRSAPVNYLWMPGEVIRLQSTFNAATNVNFGEVWLGGYEFPRGNIQR